MGKISGCPSDARLRKAVELRLVAKGKFSLAIFRRKFLGKVLPAVSGGTTGRRLHTSRRRAAGRSSRQSRQVREEQYSLCAKRRCSKSVRCVPADNFPHKPFHTKPKKTYNFPAKQSPGRSCPGFCVFWKVFSANKAHTRFLPYVPLRAPEGRRTELCAAACPQGVKGDGQTCVPPRGEKGKTSAVRRAWESEMRGKPRGIGSFGRA